METVKVHYLGTNPSNVKFVVIACEKCGSDIEIVKNGKHNGGICGNPDCPMYKKAISMKFCHVETIFEYN